MTRKDQEAGRDKHKTEEEKESSAKVIDKEEKKDSKLFLARLASISGDAFRPQLGCNDVP